MFPRMSGGRRRTDELPSALEGMGEITRLMGNRRIALFVDYDGTLTPIVERPEDACLSDGMKQTIRRLAGACTVAVISGRDLQDVRSRVGLAELIYAGNHGFEIEGPGGLALRSEGAQALPPVLDQVQAMLRERIDPLPGVRLERKKFSISVHYREAPDSSMPDVREAVRLVAGGFENLRILEGKKVFELQPTIDWDKGRAVLWLLETLALDPGDVLPLYLGDDTTDEDGFRAVQSRGIGIAVVEHPVPVHPRETLARYTLKGPGEVRDFLQRLAKRMRDGPKAPPPVQEWGRTRRSGA